MADIKRIPRGIRKRIVYVDVDEELDGEQDELKFGAWLPDEGNIAGLCTANCQEVSESTYDRSEKISHALCAQSGNDMIAQAHICNADAVSDIARKWPQPEPYAFARPSESGEVTKVTRRRYKERHNYAKALLRSDRELEKLSRKIRLEIQQSEMMELAIEAERAANAGFQSFSAKPSTFGLDTHLRRTNTFSEGDTNKTLSISLDRRMKIQLRNVSEVIPQWKELHSHMRTHLFRRKVQESSLVFHEEERNQRARQVPGGTSHDSQQGFNFFGGFADVTKAKVKVQNQFLCDSTDLERVAEEESQVSAASNSSTFGPTLASHLSPRSMGKRVRRPSLSVPPGLVHPDETQTLVSPPNDTGQGDILDVSSFPYVPAALCGGTTKERVGCMCDDQRTFAESENVILCAPSSLGQQIRTPVKARFGGDPVVARDQAKASESLPIFDADKEEQFIGPYPSPRQQKTTHAAEASTLKTTITDSPRGTVTRPSEEIGYATPAGLRDIRRHTGHGISDMVLKTPELKSSGLEPSSIIETSRESGGDNDHDQESAPVLVALHKEDTLFLSLPTINDTSEKCSSGWPVKNHQTNNFRYSGRFAKSIAPGLTDTTSARIPQVSLDRRRIDCRDSFVASAGACHEDQFRSVSSEERIHSGLREDAPRLLSRFVDVREFETSGDSHQSVDILVKSTDMFCTGNLKSKGDVPCSDDGAGRAPYDQNEEKKECEQTLSGVDVQFLANHGGGTSLDRVFPFHLSMEDENAPHHENRPVEIYENIMQSAMDFDLESNDDDSSISFSAGIDDNCLWPAATWGGIFPENRMLLRKTLSWPGGTVERPDRSRFHVDDQLPAPTPPIPKQFDMNMQFPVACSDSHGICHTFPSTDENFQVVVEEMMARLSPSAGTWRRDSYVSEDENNEFLNNYFYCTKIGGDSGAQGYKSLEGQICADPCHGNDAVCHNVGVDTFCNGIQFIFDNQRAQPAASANPRQRTLSLDTSLPEDSSTSWLRSVQSLFREFGSRFEAAGQERQESVQFDPPWLKKAAP